MYIHEIFEWLSEARSLEGSVTPGVIINDFDEDSIDDHITETDSAILNGVTLTERRPSAVYNSA